MKASGKSPSSAPGAKPAVSSNIGNETVKVPPLSDQVTMKCFYHVGQEWQIREFTSKKRRYCIGSSSADSEISISEPEAERIQTVVQKIGDTWFVMEYARANLMRINGIPDFQFVFRTAAYCCIRIGGSVLVLAKVGTSMPKTHETVVNADNRFVLVSGKERKEFSTLQPCLIGTHEVADFIIKDSVLGEDSEDPVLKESFMALINSYNNQLFIEPLTAKVPVIVQGSVITEPTPVCAGTQFTVGPLSFSIPESSTLNHAGDFMDFSGIKNKRFMLLQILSENDDKAVNIELPAPGRAVTLGRGKTVTYQLPDPQLSKEHVQFIIYEKSVLAADLGSTNGTFVNDEKVRKKLMHAGDFLTVGSYSFFLCFNEESI